MKKHWKYSILGLVLALPLVSYLLVPKRPTGAAVPTPNGYDDFVKAAEAAESDGRAYPDLTDAELRAVVDQNRSTLDLARLGCKRECRVPIQYERTYLTNMAVLGRFKMVARLFVAEGLLAEREGRTNDAVRAYVDGIRFGQEFCRGGLVIHRLVGVACEAINFGPLSKLVPNLDARSCRQLAQALEIIEARRERWEATLRGERLYFGRVASLRENLFGLVERGIRWLRSWWGPVPNPRQKLERLQGSERRLTLQMAARAYELEKGKSPNRSGDLVPEYLKAMPKDPVTGAEMALPR